MTYLIDSDVCIDVLQRKATSPFVEMTVAAGAAISVITYGEVLDGFLHSSNRAQNVGVWERFVAPFQIFDVTRDVADIWAQIRGDLRLRGQRLVDNDLLIAATAIAHDLTLMTRNRRHFARIPALRIAEF
jgi:predicted nucleic acid-binding protein